MKETSEDAKTIVFSDSRQDAARAALNIESLHHQDLRRLLLVRSIQNSLSKHEPNFDIESVKLKQSEALKAGNISEIIETEAQIQEYNKRINAKRVSLKDLVVFQKVC